MVQQFENGVMITSLKKISNEKGDLFHVLKQSEQNFSGFGEAYFSSVKKKCFKGWKKHTKMVLNITVPIGAIRFYIVDERKQPFFIKTVDISENNYCRLTIPPDVWLGFEGLNDGLNMLLNIASIEHDPNEAINQEKSAFINYFPHLKMSR